MNYGIGYTFITELKKQHHDIDLFSAAFDQHRSVLEKDDAYCYDRFIEHSSNATGNVGNESEQLNKKLVWCINHYLGLNRHPQVIEKTRQALTEYGTGSGTSAMSGGRCKLHVELEEFLKNFLHKEGIILFPTGYTTNLGMISALVQKNDLILSDEENHASIIDGIRLSGKQKMVFKHNDLADLEAKLIQTEDKYNNRFVIIESAYSMSGDLAPLRELVALKKKYGFLIFLDEAHTFGFYGADGRGLASELGVLDDIDFITSTFSKSCASIGGFCSFNKKYRTFLTLRSNSYMFQASFPPATAATILAALEIFSTDGSYAKSLHQKNRYMRAKLATAGFNMGHSKSPVIPIFIPDANKLTLFEREMYQRGVFAVSVLYPAVKRDEGRIRLIVNDSHTYQDIDDTVEILISLGEKHGLIANKNKNELEIALPQLAIAY